MKGPCYDLETLSACSAFLPQLCSLEALADWRSSHCVRGWKYARRGLAEYERYRPSVMAARASWGSTLEPRLIIFLKRQENPLLMGERSGRTYVIVETMVPCLPGYWCVCFWCVRNAYTRIVYTFYKNIFQYASDFQFENETPSLISFLLINILKL